MKKNYLVLWMGSLCLAHNVSAQQFVNGSLEPTTTVNACQAVSNLTFNSWMGGTANSFGTLTPTAFDGMYLNDSACHDTTAKLGYYSLAMDWASSGYTAVALKLSANMQAGHTYTLSFWYSASIYFSSCNFQVGYSADSSVFGTLITSVSAPGTLVIMWNQRTINFTPTSACKWITLQTTTSTPNNSLSPYMYTLVDAFSLSSATSVTEFGSGTDKLQISPNPASNPAYLTFDNTMFGNDIRLTVTDMSGRTIQQENRHLSTGANSLKLNCEEIPAGIYLVNISDGNHSATQKLVLTK